MNDLYFIYGIWNLEKKKVYIGRTKCLNRRIKQHFSDLNAKTHPAILMQEEHTEETLYKVVVYDTAKGLYEASLKETFYQFLFDSPNKDCGYNQGDEMGVKGRLSQMKMGRTLFSGKSAKFEIDYKTLKEIL